MFSNEHGLGNLGPIGGKGRASQDPFCIGLLDAKGMELWALRRMRTLELAESRMLMRICLRSMCVMVILNLVVDNQPMRRLNLSIGVVF